MGQDATAKAGLLGGYTPMHRGLVTTDCKLVMGKASHVLVGQNGLGGDTWVPQVCIGHHSSVGIRSASKGCPLVHPVLASVPERRHVMDITLEVQ